MDYFRQIEFSLDLLSHSRLHVVILVGLHGLCNLLPLLELPYLLLQAVDCEFRLVFYGQLFLVNFQLLVNFVKGPFGDGLLRQFEFESVGA